MMNFLLQHGLYDFYASSMRGSLFSGFLTMGGFLFSAHTFIVIHMKKEVYEHKYYLQRIRDIRTSDPTFSHYGGLKSLSRLLVWSIISSLVAALSQLTLGLVPYNLAAIVCLVLAGLAAVVLGTSIFFMATNLRQWFTDLEDMSPEMIATLSDRKV